MRQVSTVVAATLLVGAFTVVACSGNGNQSKQNTELISFTQEVVGILGQVRTNHETLSDPAVDILPTADREALYSGLEEDMRSALAQISDLEVAPELEEAQRQLSMLLVNEREIWVHMVFYVRTGLELHRAIANDLLFDNIEIQRLAVSGLSDVVRSAGLNTLDLGLDDFVISDTPAPEAEVMTSPTPTTPANTPAPTATPSATPVPTMTPGQTRTPTAAHTPLPTLQPTSSPVGTVRPSSTPTLVPTPTSTAVPTSASVPAPIVTPTLEPGAESVPVLTEGSLVVIRYPDLSGNPALIAHWIIDVDAGVLGVVEYPFVAGDNLEISVYGKPIQHTYMESPDGSRLVDLDDLARSWNGEARAESNGTYRFYFDNTEGDELKQMHLLITYHESAEGSVLPP